MIKQGKEYRIIFAAGEGKEHDLQPVLERVARDFGGYSISVCGGGWMSPDDELVTETSFVLSVVTDRAPSNMSLLAQAIRDMMEQESVILIYPTGDTIELYREEK